MEFKIDTRDTYTHIATTAEHLDANVAEGIAQQCTSVADNGSASFLIDLHSCQSAGADAFDALAALHEQLYGEECSLVFTGLTPAVASSFKEAGLDEVLNVTPTEEEAIDIISMEILERDLLKEE
jgi:anti-anti-sigma factor